MHVTNRSYLTAGVAALGAGAIALSPVQPIPTQLAAAQERAISNLSVTLAATVDPVQAWKDTIALAQTNIAAVQAYKASRPLPLLTTIQANLQTYQAALPDTQFIVDSIKNNINTFFYAPWNPGPCATDPCGDPAFYQGINISNVPITNTVPVLGQLSQRQLYTTLPGVVDPTEAAALAPLLAFAATTYSGQLSALIGTLAGPVVQLGRSVAIIQAALAQGDTETALNQLINTPAYMTNAFLNGIGYVDLTDVINKIMPLPSTISAIGLNMGGLLSPPVKYEGTLANPTSLSAGTLFDNIATTASVGPLTVTTPGQQVGFYSAAVGLGQYLATKMLVPPPPPTAAAAPTAAVKAAAAVEAPAALEAAPAVADVPAKVEAPAPAVADDPAPAEAPAVADAPATVDAPAPQAVSASSDDQQSPSAGRSDNTRSGRSHHAGARGKHAS